MPTFFEKLKKQIYKWIVEERVEERPLKISIEIEPKLVVRLLTLYYVENNIINAEDYKIISIRTNGNFYEAELINRKENPPPPPPDNPTNNQLDEDIPYRQSLS